MTSISQDVADAAARRMTRPRYRVIEYNVRQHAKTGFGIVRVSPKGIVHTLPFVWSQHAIAGHVAQSFNSASWSEKWSA